jgi:secreted trypsin-like serine protease
MTLVASLITQPSSIAIEGGKPALGENVVTFIQRDNATGNISGPLCSAGLIAPRIVVTAKHCIDAFNTKDAGRLVRENWEVTFPGSDVSSSKLQTAKILSIFANPGEFTTTDDIAVIVIDREFPVQSNLKVATPEDMSQLRAVQAKSITYGYGSNSTSFLQSTKPLKIENRIVQDFPDGGSGLELFAIQYLNPDSYICGGDSGGPNYVLWENITYYIGPTGFGTRPGCEKGLVGDFYSGGTAVAYKLNIVKDAENYLSQIKLVESASLERAATKAVITEKTIICLKGKSLLKVVGKNPKCPAGYKVKK